MQDLQTQIFFLLVASGFLCRYQDAQINLEKVLIRNGIRVVTCEGYDGLGINYVRINLNKDFETMLECLKNADKELAG